ncbi:non-ribosomal peptide synthetase [Streptomyces sedi]|uniref:Amino acid adenylation domain-containing protein n=1 Tax=Streptomyces sedi TaxID=555059 RepID=A0A5C4VF52_9ACTN|nr:non-ribosomal peptide synthetase [Streptomyces sedi]TNM34402.1 amino acid adenylation domain-containing protein [Streptomyces sedi]
MPEYEKTELPVLAAQKGLWFAQQLDPANPAYNIAEYVDVRGEVDVDALARAVDHVVRETEALRVTFGEREGIPHQLLHSRLDMPLPLVDLRGDPDPFEEALRRMRRELSRPADTAVGPLVRVVLYRLADDRHLFHQQVHHLALDGYGAALALTRIAEVYGQFTAAPDVPVPLRPAPLLPVLEEEQKYRASERSAADQEFWSSYLAGAPEPVGLRDGTAVPARFFHLAGEERDALWLAGLKDAAKTAGAGWPSMFIAATAAYLHRIRGVGEVVLGLPVTARRTDLTRSTPTMLSNVLPLRIEVSPADTVEELLRRTSRQVRTVLRHQRYPAEDLRRDRGLLGRRERLTGPAVNVLAFDDTLAFGPATATLHNLSIGPVEDLVVAAHASFADGGLRLDLLANPELHAREELRAHRDRFLRLLDEFVVDPSRPLGSIGLLGGAERDRVTGLAAGPPRREADTGADAERGGPAALPVQLARQAASTPGETAVVCGEVRLSFAELDGRVDRLAHRLVRAGAGPGSRVAVALPRSTDLVVALLAVMRAGAAYLPVDPSYPGDRVAFMLADSAPVALVADVLTASTVDPRGDLPRIDPGDVRSPRAEPPMPFAEPSARDTAYVIYTSGSTGTPKGVVVEHRSLSNLLEHHRRESHACAVRALGRGLRVALTAATSFDASWDPVLWMVAGHELHVVDDRTRTDPEALVAFLRGRRIDAIETTPSYLQQLLAAGLLTGPGHRPHVIALGGEAVNDALWAQLSPHPDLLVFNFYGPTEATVDAVTSRVSGGTPVIGRPVSGARAYVLDAGMHPLPVGTAGELYLSGEGVARGYNRRPGLTADRFLPDPFGPSGSRMYRTGDLARWREDGSLEFLGRTDGQVKIRGFRVEAGEVESALTALPPVREASVVARPGAGGLAQLAAYVVLDPAAGSAFGDGRHEGDQATLAALRSRLAVALPDHMIPALYAAVDRLPLTPNGKLDTAALPEATAPRAGDGQAPRTSQEATLCAAFAESLGLDARSVGRDDDFFALGGHSLLATRLVGHLRTAFDVELPVRALFEAPTPAALARRLEGAAPARAALAPVLPRPERLPLSPAQRRLWLLESIGEGGAAYHLPLALRLSGPLDVDALRDALHDVTGRHESLRTVFPEDEHGPHQRVLPAELARPALDVVPAPDGLPAGLGRRPFDLARSLPLRAELFVLDATEHVLLLTLHHIAADGWSLNPMMRDLGDAYAARVAGRAPRWEPLPVQYADYALWHHRTLGDPDEPDSQLATQLAYWGNALADLPAECTFPVDRLRPVRAGGGGGCVALSVSAEVHGRVVALGRELGASTFMVVHGALSALLCRLGGGTDVVVGSPVAGRTDEALAGLVGFFVNTLVLRVDVSGDPSFREVVGRVREVDLAAYGHQEVPFERLVEEVAPVRSLARHPLFQVMLALNNTERPRLDLPGLHARHETSVGRTGAKFDLTWDLTERHTPDGAPAGLTGELEYSGDLFDRATAQRFADHLVRLLTAALDDPERPVTDLDFLDPVQRLAALDQAVPGTSAPAATGSGPTDGGEAPGTIVDVFTTQALVTPRRTAVVDAEGPVTFGDLLRRVQLLAARLHEEGIRPGDRVASALPRGTGQIVALLAVLRCGAVHVPLDPTHPVERNRVILDNARPARVLTDASTAARLPDGAHRPLRLDGSAGASADRVWPLPHRPAPGDAAYVLYTSGSTGTPKGVVVEHRSLARLLASHRARLMDPAEAANHDRPLRVALTAAATFDASWDPILWMVAGHELHVVDDATRRDPEALTAFLHAHRVDMLETTPSFLEQLRAHGLLAPGRPRPRLLALGGEPVGEGLWNELAALRDTTVWNLYGPTEATVDSVICQITPGTGPRIGHAVDGTSARVLDARLRPVAPGTPGELYLAGASLARGYEGRPALTAERFLADPHGPAGSRMYRTGDLVRRLPDGGLQYLGRGDDQVKVRGFRVETAEVEAALTRHAGVARSAVAVRPDSSGAGTLVAWIVPEGGPGHTTEGIRRFVADQLPGYMVPSAIAAVPDIPLTVHGKADLDALPDPRSDSAAHDAPPRSAQEEILCALFADSLGRPAVGRDADFFDLGGHSLLATRLVSRVREAFGVELPVRALFEARTPAALAHRLGEAGKARPALRPVDRADRAPLSYAQRRLWFLHRMDPRDPAYHIPVAVRLEGALDLGALRAALGDVVARHESLRTLFHDPSPTGDAATVAPASEGAEDEAVQVILEPGDARPPLLRTMTSATALPGALRAAAARPFDLTAEPPLRVELFTTAFDRHVLLLTAHHIATDGWSMGPLAQDLAGAYAARVAGRAPRWEPLPVQYADYALWQRDLLGSARDSDSLLHRQLAYWKSTLAGLPEEMPLPVDRLRPVRAGGGGGCVALSVSAEVHGRVVALGRELGASTFMVVHGALSALLCRLGGGTDVVVGSPVAGRTDEALAGLVGFFVNTLVLRVDVSGDPSFREVVGRVREVDLAAYGHQEVPFERLVEEVAPVRSLARHPLFQVMLALNNTERPRLDLPGLHAEWEGVDTGAAKFDLSLSLTERPSASGGAGGLKGTLEFSRDLFDTENAQDIADWFPRLLEQAVTAPDTPVSRLSPLTERERHALLALGDGGPGLAEETTLLHRFAETLPTTRGGDLAVTAPDGCLTFPELETRANRLAHWLRGRGVTTGDTVAVRIPRSTDSVAVLLGVLKAGAVYAPLDPALPPRRVAAVLEDARPALVLTTVATAGDLPQGSPWAALDDPDTSAALAAAPGLPLPEGPGPHDAAYLLHTSGSTGRPKGVLVEHRSLGRLHDHHRQHLFTPARRAAGDTPLNVALTASLSFDASWDPVQWMVAGHALHIVDDTVRRDPEALVAHVRAHAVDVLETTPTHLRQLLDAGLLAPDAPHRPSHLVLGGEAVPAALWSRLHAEPELTCWSFYGPTEATVDTLEARLADTAHPVLGTPVAGTRAYVLDDHLGLAPAGVPGELYLAGDSLARGYPGRPGESAVRFLPDPFGPAGQRMYRTGDLARWTRAGHLEFLGRADSQVQVRGFRVEPDEVAAVLETHPAVSRAAVVLDEDETGGRLLAYLVPNGQDPSPADGALDTESVRAHATRLLPDYMVPSLWTALESLPLTASGKLDHRSLPAPATAGRPRGRAPRTPREEVLCTLFAEALDREQVGADEDFFALGGHSLLATRLIGRVRQVLGVELGIRALFEAPTVQALAARLESGTEEDPLAVLLPLRAGGDRTPLFCFPPANGLSWSYTAFLAHLDPAQPLYGLQSPVLRGAPHPESMEEMAALYVQAMRTVQPHGPYRLLGWSFGGNVAHEAAVLLRRSGEEVELLALMDAFPLAPRDGLEDADRDTVFRALLTNLGIGADVLDGDEAVDAASVSDALLRTGNPLGSLGPETLDAMVEHFAGQARAMRHHTPGVFDGDVLFFTATEGRAEAASGPELWAPHVTGRFDNHDVPFAHAQLTQPRPARHIGLLLAAALRALPGAPGS